jgi:hypothetical protein
MKLSILLILLISPISSIYLKISTPYIINKKNYYVNNIPYEEPVIRFNNIQNIILLFNFSNFSDEHMKISSLLF